MNCSRCGTALPDNATFCTNCGNPSPAAPPPPPGAGPAGYPPQGGYAPQPAAYGGPAPNVPDYLIWSIITTVCCCLPLGIAGIVLSIQAKSAMQLGNFDQAVSQSKWAFYCNLISWIVGGIGTVIYIILIAIGVAAESGNF